MNDLRELYQEVIMDHNRSPRNYGSLENANRTAEGFNPLCGDQLQVYLYVNNDAIIEEVEISNQLFEQSAGLAPVHFAYPSGSRSQSSDDILAPKYTTLRRWRDNPQPIHWVFTDADTPLTEIECQNIDNCVGFEDFTRIFQEAS